MTEWKHPGGKLRRSGPRSCTNKELLTIVIGSGSNGRTAEQIADEILDKFWSIYGFIGRDIKELEQIKGLKKAKARRIAAVYELAFRILRYADAEYQQQQQKKENTGTKEQYLNFH